MNARWLQIQSAYLSEPEWIAADSAYRLSTTAITPSRKNSTQLDAASRSNQYFSTNRVRVEHLFGILKENSSSCKKLPIRITDARSHEFACTWVRFCCILHNILLPVYDEEDFQNDHHFEPNRAEEQEDSSEDDDTQLKRNALFEVLHEKL